MIGPCPGWEYENEPNHGSILLERAGKLVSAMYAPTFDTLQAVSDTRPAHRQMFAGLTPRVNPKYAGNYRGSKVDPCLQLYRVEVKADPRVGSPPQLVERHMEELSSIARESISALDDHYNKMALDEFANYLIELGSLMLEFFFRVHPYANGNGHMGRYMLTALFKRYGFRFTDAFPIEPKPTDREHYSNCFTLYRSGNKDPLHAYMAECLDRSPGPPQVHSALRTLSEQP